MKKNFRLNLLADKQAITNKDLLGTLKNYRLKNSGATKVMGGFAQVEFIKFEPTPPPSEPPKDKRPPLSFCPRF
jgi:hypothetical protein